MFSIMIGFVIAYVIAQIVTFFAMAALMFNPRFLTWGMKRYMKVLERMNFDDEDLLD